MGRPQQTELARPFGKHVKKNPTGYGDYVPHPVYKERLLQLNIPWDFELVQVIRGWVEGKPAQAAKDGKPARPAKPALDNAVVGAVYRLTVEVDGQRRVIEEVGDCEDPHNWSTDGARMKDAASDAFKRCCAHLGLGLHLYVKDQADYFLFKRLSEGSDG